MTALEKITDITDSIVLTIIRTTQAAMSAAVGTFGLALIAAPVAVGASASNANTLASARTAAFALAFTDADPARSETVGEDLSSATDPLPPGTFTTSVHSDEARQGQNTPPAKDPPQVKEWFYIGPHVMIVLPDSAKEALRGINTDLSKNEPYVTRLNPSAHSTPLWVIPVAKSGERIGGEKPN
jgi:hypothetical protein